MNCPHCDGELSPHDGMRHCDGCGCYFDRSGELAPDHTACREAHRRAAAEAEAAAAIEVDGTGAESTEEEPPVEEAPADRRTRKSR